MRIDKERKGIFFGKWADIINSEDSVKTCEDFGAA